MAIVQGAGAVEVVLPWAAEIGEANAADAVLGVGRSVGEALWWKSRGFRVVGFLLAIRPLPSGAVAFVCWTLGMSKCSLSRPMSPFHLQ